MNVSIGARWEEFVASVIGEGRYGSASEVVREGLRLVEEREARLQALRETLDASIARGESAPVNRSQQRLMRRWLIWRSKAFEAGLWRRGTPGPRIDPAPYRK